MPSRASMTPCHSHVTCFDTCDTSSRSCDNPSLERDVGQENSLSHRESPITLGVGISNQDIAGTKANESASERDRARSVPDSRTGVQFRVKGGGLSVHVPWPCSGMAVPPTGGEGARSIRSIGEAEVHVSKLQ